jgi:hypothetical protein
VLIRQSNADKRFLVKINLTMNLNLFNFKKALFAFILLGGYSLNAQFSNGNLVVLQAGDGVTTLTNTGNPIILREFMPNGTPAFSVAVPSGSNNPIIISGAASSEGVLSLSSNQKYLVFGGYAAALPGNTIALAASGSSVINRAAGVVSASGSYTQVAVSSSMYSGNNLRSVASDGAGNFWGAGGNDGTDYLGAGTPTNVQNVKTNSRVVALFNNQLYLSTQSAAGTQTNLGIYSIGNGTSIASGQTITPVIITGAGSQPAQFFFNATSDVCYVADQRTVTAMGGIQKWVYSAPNWSLAYTLGSGAANVGAFGVVADFSGTNPIIYATTSESSANRLISIVDAGPSSTATTLATAGSNSIFRGIAFTPTSAIQTGIRENTGNKEVVIYPNPAGEELKIQLSNSSRCNFTIYDAHNKRIKSGEVNSNATVNIKDLQPGLYVMQILDGELRISKSFIKE